MLQLHTSKQKSAFMLIVLGFAGIAINAQDTKRTQPAWWFGQSAAANFNVYRGTTQMLNEGTTVPSAFHKGNGIKPYFSLLTEYRPNRTWGGMLNVAYDNRGGKFNGVMAPCDCPANLSTNISYVAIEPSLRWAPFSSAFYLFGGPTINFNLSKSFTYSQDKQIDKRQEWSDIRKTAVSAQAGAGIDLMLSTRTNPTQVSVSPFVSFLTDLGHSPRRDQTWAFYTVRAGLALKIGTSKKQVNVIPVTEPVAAAEKGVQFSVRAPRVLPLNRPVKETFPLRNSVFFDGGATAIPSRYVMLNKQQAASFREEDLQQSQPDNLVNGRSSRQMAVYHNILNIMGDRLRVHPQSSLLLSGASDKNPTEGKQLAENIKHYLVTIFGISASRISTEGRDKPVVPSEQREAMKELTLLHEGDRRVDIVSVSPELMMQVGGNTSPFLKPVQIIAVQEDPLDSHVLLNAAGAAASLTSWSVEVTDEQGTVKKYGPYTGDQASIPGKAILGNSTQGNYKIVMLGERKSGGVVREESTVSLMKMEDAAQTGLRHSILFDFDRSKSVDSYESFLRDVITPLIPENGTVIIHGHTDIIGDEKYNHSLSNERAIGTQQVLERALSNTNKKGVKFATYGFGEDVTLSPFENNYPEERFYNRTVIIDIVPNK